jgi:hypothetical protein
MSLGNRAPQDLQNLKLGSTGLPQTGQRWSTIFYLHPIIFLQLTNMSYRFFYRLTKKRILFKTTQKK